MNPYDLISKLTDALNEASENQDRLIEALSKSEKMNQNLYDAIKENNTYMLLREAHELEYKTHCAENLLQKNQEDRTKARKLLKKAKHKKEHIDRYILSEAQKQTTSIKEEYQKQRKADEVQFRKELAESMESLSGNIHKQKQIIAILILISAVNTVGIIIHSSAMLECICRSIVTVPGLTATAVTSAVVYILHRVKPENIWIIIIVCECEILFGENIASFGFNTFYVILVTITISCLVLIFSKLRQEKS